MNWELISLRALQTVSIISAIIAITGGGAFVLWGSDGLAVVVGREYPSLSPALVQAAANIDPSVKSIFDIWYRALGWYWLVTGIMLLWIIPKIQYRSDWFRLIHVSFMAVGIARALTIAEHGVDVQNRHGAVAIELSVPIILIIWQWFVARAAASVPDPAE